MSLSLDTYRTIFVTDGKLLAAAEFEEVARKAELLQLPLDQVLINTVDLSEDQYVDLLAHSFGVPAASMKLRSFDSELLALIPKDFATEQLVFPFAIEDQQVCIAMVDPADQAVVERLYQTAGQNIKLFVTTESRLRKALVLYEGDIKTRLSELVSSLQTQIENHTEGQEVSVAPLVELILSAAVLEGASDIHIEPYEHELAVRFRTDGQLSTYISLPTVFTPKIIAELKIKTNLKIDDSRSPQDGRCSYDLVGEAYDIRLSTLPSIWGEKIVMRLLSKATQLSGIANLGMLPLDLKVVRQYLSRPHGMILVTGPTNSGKSTTLYACLQQIELAHLDGVNITTIEDPVEYSMPGAVQVQASPELTFADGLRAMLRQDLDVLMVGEIRDQETAELSIRASLAGRLVFSTLHSNDAFGTLPRLIDIGVQPYLIASAIDLIISQRLAKKLCVHCRQAYQPDAALLQQLRADHNLDSVLQQLTSSGTLAHIDATKLTFYHAAGCEECNHSGFRGRTGIYEVMPMTPELQNAAYQKFDSDHVRQIAVAGGVKTMFVDGMAKVLLGQISLEELFATSYA